jgi:hypothetical protein
MKTLNSRYKTHEYNFYCGKNIKNNSSLHSKLYYNRSISKLKKFWIKWKKKLGIPSATKAYHHLRYRWWDKADIGKIKEELDPKFSIILWKGPRTEGEINLFTEERDVLKIKADTLYAYLDIYKAILFQKEPAVFTKRDMELREKIFKIYTRITPFPYPLIIENEPKFEVTS